MKTVEGFKKLLHNVICSAEHSGATEDECQELESYVCEMVAETQALHNRRLGQVLNMWRESEDCIDLLKLEIAEFKEKNL